MTTPEKSTVAVFVALTRSVREAPIDDEVRRTAFDAIERMGRCVAQRCFASELEVLRDLAALDENLGAVLQAFWAELYAMTPAKPVR